MKEGLPSGLPLVPWALRAGRALLGCETCLLGQLKCLSVVLVGEYVTLAFLVLGPEVISPVPQGEGLVEYIMSKGKGQ